jgi:hypothetical protein
MITVVGNHSKAKLMKKRKYVCIIVWSILLSACANNPELEIVEDVTSTKPSTSGQGLLRLADQAKSISEQTSLRLQAAELLYENELEAQAYAALLSIPIDSMTNEQRNRYYDLSLDIALDYGDIATITNLLSNFSTNELLQTSIEQQQRRISQRTRALETINQPLQAAITLSEHSTLFSLDDTPRINEEVWLLLRQSPREILAEYQYQGRNQDVIAWLELARSMKLQQSSLDEQYEALSIWRERWPAHPATQALPLELELLNQLPNTTPEKVILALPLSGRLERAGSAIRDGFLTQHFAKAPYSTSLNIELFDTQKQSLDVLYQKAASERTLIVGPLSKNLVDKINEGYEKSAPILALNQPTATISGNDNLYIFSLNPEDEITQIVKNISKNNQQRVAILAPRNARGERLTKSFTEQFKSLGGNVLETSFYKNDQALSNAVADLVATSQSKNRAKNLRQITGLNLESEPRRRKDLDAIFMIANAKTSKQVKPLLAFNFAKDIPVYAMQQANDPYNTNDNNDLNGIQFIEMPWVLNKSNTLKQQVDTYQPNLAKAYSRFFALGADAYTLAPRLSLLHKIPTAHIPGLTGLLSISDEGQVIRELQWVEFKRGKPSIIY